jgi:uncharacterized membrane protein
MTITDTIDIAAPVSLVWRVTADVEKWAEWTPTVTSVRLVNGERLRLGSIATIKQPMQSAADWTVVEYEEERRFAWQTSTAALRFKGVHDLAPSTAGTRNTLAVEATGFLALLLWPVLRLAIRKSLRDENAGLKRRCEQEAKAVVDGR